MSLRKNIYAHTHIDMSQYLASAHTCGPSLDISNCHLVGQALGPVEIVEK